MHEPYQQGASAKLQTVVSVRFFLLGALVDVRMRVRGSAVLVHMDVYVTAPRQLAQSIHPQANQHQSHGELQRLLYGLADLQMQHDDQDARSHQ